MRGQLFFSYFEDFRFFSCQNIVSKAFGFHIKNYNLHIFQRGGNRDLRILEACFRFFYEDCNLMPGTKKLVTKYSSSAHKSSPFP